jgi:hypothetical protein
MVLIGILALNVSLAMAAQTRERAARTPEAVMLNASPDVVAAYNALSALEPAQRKALYAAFTNEVRAGLRRLQHQIYLADHPEMSAEQRAVLLGLIGQLTPEMYAPPALGGASPAARAEMERLHQHAAAIFSPNEMQEIFFRLGGDRPAQHRWRVAPQSDCECEDDDECGGLTCVFRGCTFIPHACGPDYAYACTGLCQ